MNSIQIARKNSLWEQAFIPNSLVLIRKIIVNYDIHIVSKNSKSRVEQRKTLKFQEQHAKKKPENLRTTDTD